MGEPVRHVRLNVAQGPLTEDKVARPNINEPPEDATVQLGEVVAARNIGIQVSIFNALHIWEASVDLVVNTTLDGLPDGSHVTGIPLKVLKTLDQRHEPCF